MPPGMVIFDDPPSHTAYRGLMSRVFTPRKMNAIEPEVRRYCQIELDALEGQNEFDIVEVLAAKMPMRVIGMLLGIPEENQQAIRDATDGGLRLDSSDDYSIGVQGLQRFRHPGPVRRVPRLADGEPVRRRDDPARSRPSSRTTPASPAASPAKRCSATSTCSPAPATRPPPS